MDAISVSQLNLYRACSLKYRFQYIDKIPKLFKSSGLAFGSAMHSAIEWLHKERLEGRDITVDELVKMFAADWYSQKLGIEIRIKDGESEDELAQRAKTLLGLYYEKGPKNATHTELPFRVSLVDVSTGEVLDVPLIGYIDLVEGDEILDEIKTSASAMDIESLDTQFQLLAYAYAFEVTFKRSPKAIKLIDLVKTKKPRIEITEVEKLGRAQRWFFHTTKEAIRGIREGVFFPNPSFRCKECEYQKQCGAWPL